MRRCVRIDRSTIGARSRRAVSVLAVALLLAAGITAVAALPHGSRAGAVTTNAGGFQGVTPKRLLDTREAGQGPCLASTRNLTVTGGATTIPTGASAVALNVTVVTPAAGGFLTVYPAGGVRPTASNLNYLAGQVVPNGVLVKVGTGEQITLFANAGCPDVVVDVVGYYANGTPVVAGGFQGLQPRRLLDTREFGQGPCVTGTRDLTVTGGLTTVPDTAAAVALNVTVVSPYAPGYVTVFPKGATRPTASNLNYRAGQIVPNNVVVKVGSAGQISLFAFDGCPNLVVDVVGYFEGGSPVGDGGFTGVTPKRLLDTREPGQTPCVSSVRNLTVTGGLTTIPANAAAVALNVTVAAPTDSGFLTVFPAGATQPTASTLNFVSGQVVPNGTVVKVEIGRAHV